MVVWWTVYCKAQIVSHLEIVCGRSGVWVAPCFSLRSREAGIRFPAFLLTMFMFRACFEIVFAGVASRVDVERPAQVRDRQSRNRQVKSDFNAKEEKAYPL